MYAIIEDGSRQYRVEPNALVTLDYREIQPGEPLELSRVLLLQSGADTFIGKPVVEGARVLTEVVELPTKKSIIQKFRRRKNYRRLKGHTQPFVRVRIKHILKAGEQPPVEAPTTEVPPVEAPKPEQPIAEAPKTEQPIAEAPKTETPPVEAPKPEQPVAEAPKTEVPPVEAPTPEQPVAEAPKTEQPGAEGPTPTA
jgi:large subunit ribosomal protein L21